MNIRPTEPLNLDNELSSEFDDESYEMRVARFIKKYEHLPMVIFGQILKRNFSESVRKAAFRIYMENKV